MDKEYITQYKDQLQIKRYAKSTIKTYISQIHVFLDFFQKEAQDISVKEIESYIKIILKNV